MALSDFFKKIVETAESSPARTTSPSWMTNALSGLNSFMTSQSPGIQNAIPTTYAPQPASYNQNFVQSTLNPSMTSTATTWTPASGQGGWISQANQQNPTPTAQYSQPAGPQQAAPPAPAATGGLGGPNIPSLEDQNSISDIATRASDMGVSTFTPSDLANGQKTKYQELLESAMNYYLGYDQSPEAKRLAQLQQQLGNLQGAYRQSLAQIETAPGLTTFQAGRREQALSQAAGGVIDPLQAEIEILQNQMTGKESRMKNALGIAEMLKPQTIGSPIIDEMGNGKIISQDPATGSYYTINLGKIGSAKPVSTDVAEYEWMKQNNGYTGTFLQYLAAKTGATTKATGGGTSSTDLASLAAAVIDNPELYNQLTPTVKGKLAPILYSAGFDGFGKALSDGALKNVSEIQSGLDQLAYVGQEMASLDPQTGPLGSVYSLIPGSDTQKYRAQLDLARQLVGKALEGGVLRKEDEEKYKKILPTSSDTKATALYKLDLLSKTLSTDLKTYLSLQASSGRDTSNVTVGTGGTSQYNVGQVYENADGQRGRYNSDGTFTIVQ